MSAEPTPANGVFHIHLYISPMDTAIAVCGADLGLDNHDTVSKNCFIENVLGTWVPNPRGEVWILCEACKDTISPLELLEMVDL